MVVGVYPFFFKKSVQFSFFNRGLYLQSGSENPFMKLAVNNRGERAKNLTILGFMLSTSFS